ncbi:MAG: hypothetical protein AABY09_02545 [Nanoarchaeota archaeon]
MARINFKCKRCSHEFDSVTGKITFGVRLSFEKDIICPICGKRGVDDLELTELGQTQISELYFLDETT